MAKKKDVRLEASMEDLQIALSTKAICTSVAKQMMSKRRTGTTYGSSNVEVPRSFRIGSSGIYGVDVATWEYRRDSTSCLEVSILFFDRRVLTGESLFRSKKDACPEVHRIYATVVDSTGQRKDIPLSTEDWEAVKSDLEFPYPMFPSDEIKGKVGVFETPSGKYTCSLIVKGISPSDGQPAAEFEFSDFSSYVLAQRRAHAKKQVLDTERGCNLAVEKEMSFAGSDR